MRSINIAKKEFKCKKLGNNIFKCGWRSGECAFSQIITNEYFYYNQKINKVYNKKVSIEGSSNDDQNFNFDNYKEI